MGIRPVKASGLEALGLATELLHRVRLADAHAGIWEAADLQWWWRMPRRSDAVGQVFWHDAAGPMAAVLLTEWQHAWGIDPIFVPNASLAVRTEAWSEATARVEALRLPDVETLVRDDDDATQQLLRASGFEPGDDRSGETWMDPGDRRPTPPLPDGFALVDRSGSGGGVHPMAARNGPAVEARLNEAPLYDPALDLAILAPNGAVAAYGLFWFDPVTRVGLVEPMRTEDAWQRRGLARALLLNGLDRLAGRGATRLKVGYSTAAARNLYLGAGFRAGAEMTTYARSSGPARKTR